MSRTFEEVTVTHLSNGEKISLPIHTIKGKKPGPTMGISASIHGDEVIGSEIIRRVYEFVDEEQLAGTLLLLPVANPMAFEGLSRNTPMDMNNLNRLFPGNKNGWVSELLADSIVENFLDRIDYYIDLHAGGEVPIVDYIYIHNDEEMSKSFNFPLLYRPSNPYEGTTATYTMEKGIPSVTVEIGGGPNFEKDIEKGFQGVINCLRHLNILPENPEITVEQTILTEIKIIRPKQGGMLVPEYDFESVGEKIEGKQVLSKIYNPKTFELLETIETPFEQNIVVLMRGFVGKVNAGDYGYMLGNLETAEKE